MKQPVCEMAENVNHFLKRLISEHDSETYGSAVTHCVCGNIRFPGRRMGQKYYPQPPFCAALREEERKGREACV